MQTRVAFDHMLDLNKYIVNVWIKISNSSKLASDDLQAVYAVYKGAALSSVCESQSHSDTYENINLKCPHWSPE